MDVSTLLDFIARYESRGDYNVVWNGIKGADRPKTALTTMTVAEVLAWQDSIDARYMSEAAGRYQILEDTLRGLYRQAGVPLTALFDKSTQDKLAIALLRRRGLDDYLSGRMSLEAFALALAKEWASLPVPFDINRGRQNVKRGQSYYAGDGLNKAHADLDEFLAVIQSVRGQAAPEPRRTPASSTTLHATIAAALAMVVQMSKDLKAAAAVFSDMFGISTELAVGSVGLIALAWIFRERLRKWARGDC